MDGCLVNSNNEWDPLKEVIVGRGHHCLTLDVKRKRELENYFK